MYSTESFRWWTFERRSGSLIPPPGLMWNTRRSRRVSALLYLTCGAFNCSISCTWHRLQQYLARCCFVYALPRCYRCSGPPLLLWRQSLAHSFHRPVLDTSVTCLEMKKPSWQKARILHLSTQLEDSMFNSKESLVCKVCTSKYEVNMMFIFR